MKKYLLNPIDVFTAIFFMSISTVIICFLTVAMFFELPSSRNEIISTAALYSISIVIFVFGLLYLIKYRGYIYFREKCIVLKKGRKETRIEPNNIRWIEIKYDVRNGLKGGIRLKNNFCFSIRPCNQKEDLDFIITNNIILEIIKNHNIRIMPDQYNKIYIDTGNFDFRK